MSNLLPDKKLQNIRAEYRARFILAGSTLAIAIAVFTALSLSPSFGVLFITRPAAAEKANQVQQSKADSSDLSRAQSLVAQLSPIVAASSSASNAILDVLSQKPSGIHIDNILYTSGTDATLAVGGIGESRETIDKFRTTLQSDSRFTSVKLPVGDLIGAEGGRFTITLSGHF